MTTIVQFTSHARWVRPVLPLLAARAVNRLGAFAMGFLAVTLVAEYDVSVSVSGWVVAAFGLASIPSRLIGGRLADALGRRRTIVVGLVGSAAALLVIASANGLGQTLLGAVLLGLAFELYEPPSQALVAELVPAERLAQAFGLLGAALSVAGVGAGLLAVLVGGIDLRLLFVADAASCLVAAVIVVCCVHEPAGSTPMPGVAPRSSPWRDRRLLVMLATGTGLALGFIAFTTALPLTLAVRGFDPAATGWLLALSALVVVLGQRGLRFARRAPFGVMATGHVLLAVGFAALAYAAEPLSLAAATVVISLGEVCLLGPPFAIVAGLASEGSRAGYLAAYGTCWGIAQTVAPPTATHLLEIGVPVLWLAAAGLCLLLAAAQAPVGRVVARTPSAP